MSTRIAVGWFWQAIIMYIQFFFSIVLHAKYTVSGFGGSETQMSFLYVCISIHTLIVSLSSEINTYCRMLNTTTLWKCL